MHAYVRIADQAVRDRARRHMVQLRSARSCFLGGEDREDCGDYLFSFASLDERAIREGIRRIARR